MWRYAIGLAVSGIITAQLLNGALPGLSPERNGVQEEPDTASEQIAAATNEIPSSNSAYTGRKFRIRMDNRGHFVTDARMNGRRVEVLVDTGATSVAINKSTARRIGINLRPTDFKYTVNTANGKTKAASATIDRIEIGRVVVRNVRAAVLEDRALSSTLLGMTFLNELRGFQVSNGELILTQ